MKDMEHLQNIYANQADRPADMVAKTTRAGKDLYLYEYTMPAGTTALVVVAACDVCHGTGQRRVEGRSMAGLCNAYGCWGKGYKKVRNISYTSIPKFWIKAIVEQGTTHMLTWNPQQGWDKKIREAQARFKEIADQYRSTQ